VLTSRTSRTRPTTVTQPASNASQFVMTSLLSAGVIVTCLIPVLLVGRGTLDGLVRVWENKTQLNMLLREILFGMGYALTGATIAVFLADRLSRKARDSRPALAGVVVASLPGLVGSLVLSLALIRLLQLPLARIAYKSSFSFALGLVLFLLPRALLLRVLLLSASRSTGYHAAMLLRESPVALVRDHARRLTWQLRWSGEFWGLVLLAWWGFLELTIANLLAPVTIVSAPVMLYNQMHFGKNAILSALVFLTVFIPVLLFMAAAAARSFFFRLVRR
jgi:ABC-type spermidine/putrescine transport system permease subunit II